MPKSVAIIGGGPAGLMAADYLCLNAPDIKVTVYDAMPSFGRKFLMAGKSGLNISHGEEFDIFLSRFKEASGFLKPALENFTADDIRAWAGELGIVTFVGTSGRIFPTGYKAAPLLRSWIKRLRENGVQTKTRHKWVGWDANDQLLFETESGNIAITADATILALGGASWPQLGSDASWVPHLTNKDVSIAEFEAANCGFNVNWTDFFRDKFEGVPVKSCLLNFVDKNISGDFVITKYGVESGPIYALSSSLRESLKNTGSAILSVDLMPFKSVEELTELLARPKGSQSMATHLKKTAGIQGVKAALLREFLPKETFTSPAELAKNIKALPIALESPRPVEEAISAAGGVKLGELETSYMIKKRPGVFCAGEMLDWEAPTGGYLLTACMATGLHIGKSVSNWLKS